YYCSYSYQYHIWYMSSTKEALSCLSGQDTKIIQYRHILAERLYWLDFIEVCDAVCRPQSWRTTLQFLRAYARRSLPDQQYRKALPNRRRRPHFPPAYEYRCLLIYRSPESYRTPDAFSAAASPLFPRYQESSCPLK